jgi:hypothetical protein
MNAPFEMRRTLKTLCRLAPFAVLVMGVNALGDPARVLTNGGYERRLAEILLSRRHAAGISNYDDRLLQRLYASGLPLAPEVLVLGSSRVMPLRADLFAPRSFFNAGVSSATLDDILAVQQVFAERGNTGRGPSLILVGIDPWMLRANEAMVAWQTLAPEHERACREAGGPDCDAAPPLAGPRRVLNALFSPRYFQASVSSLWQRATDPVSPPALPTPVTSDTAEPSLALRRADGSLRYPNSFGIDPNTVRESARAFGRDFRREGIPYLPTAALPEPRFVHTLATFVRWQRDKGADVRLLLVPYHPDAWPDLSAPGSTVVNVEDAVRKIGADTAVEVLGSFDPNRAGCRDGREFDDPSHPRASCLERILAGARPLAALSGGRAQERTGPPR